MVDEQRDAQIGIDCLNTENPIEQVAEQYIGQACPPQASDVQRIVMRDAFWAGAGAVFGLVMATNASRDEDDAALRLATLHKELAARGMRIEIVEGGHERRARAYVHRSKES